MLLQPELCMSIMHLTHFQLHCTSESWLAVQNSIYFAYFPPYSYHRHQELVAATHVKKGVSLEILGPTLDGHDLDLLRIGELLVVVTLLLGCRLFMIASI